ncbi:hypothetical protein BKA91DRAFT_136104 [Yarrowia lipolytica]|nr:hypothetical protein BKA91DRAFT_136104 [Yarrowia lipolytica]KAE8169943.1 hypothetical protein BKA90DRAFT_141644 [Yarrowia lipolytica]RMI94495.1 hypothetical protein BD777DRAFT_131556 [Yarrowia lipolytica]
MATLQKTISKTGAGIFIPGAQELTYSQFFDLIGDFQKQLAQVGLPPQSAVSIAIPNSLEFAVTFLAVTFSRYIAAPLNSAYKKSEFEFYIDDLKSKLVLVPKGAVAQNLASVQAARTFNAAIAEVYWDDQKKRIVMDIKEGPTNPPVAVPTPDEVSPEDVALVLHTSGTTGRPKAVPLTQRNLCRTMHNIVDTYKLTSKDTTYLVMPLFHVHGLLCAFLAPLASGGGIVIPSKFSASQFWDDFVKYKCNWYTAVPTIHQILLNTKIPQPLPEIRFIRSCSSALAPATFHQIEKAFKAPVLEAYAMTEAAHQMTSNNLPPGQRKPGTVGVGQGVEVAILDDNGDEVPQGKIAEICIRGENVTKGYINNPEANKSSFTKSGFFRTGDQGFLDKDGFVNIPGRIKELINRGGEKISPIELDGVMLEHPAVAEAVCFGAPDEMYGQQVNAAIVLKKDAKATEQDIKDFMADKVAKFKIPARVFFTDIMPKTATGKIQRRFVAQKFLDKAKL